MKREDAENFSAMRPVDRVSGLIVDSAFRIYRELGPGLMESVYETILARSLERRGLEVERQRPVSFEFEGIRFNDACRVDLLVSGLVVVELKSVEKLAPIHTKQLLTYLRVLRLEVGLLINFGAPTFRDAISRVVNNYSLERALPLELPDP